MEFSLHRKEKKATPVDEPSSESYTNKLKTASTSSMKNTKNKNSKKAKNLHSKAKSSKKITIQMVNNDHPTEFEKTKDAFYSHLKLLWGLLEKRKVPAPPKPEQLKEFYQRFSNADQIETAIENDGPTLLPAQHQHIADWKRVAFLQNPKCLLEFTLPDKQIGDQSFNDKYWEVLAKDYNLEFLSFDVPDDDNDPTKEESNYGESLELDIGEEEESKEEKDEELKPVRRKEKGKAQMVEDEEESSENDNMEIDNAASNGFYGGLTEEEWNAWQ
ncbi:hypothetical protein O181_045342 [Austropuccinia psidii MF-1]|uniref:Uncharacterized protein n=1 Tax=Austropuccinia psidii MF-1 TaxID=1389203 RepID=A0A9Q3DP77_9BASI|nr:hypothetical protein [Austropuccinia psidii MF-1]